MEGTHSFGFQVILVLFASTAAVSSTTLDLVRFGDSVDIYCNDGTSGGYYFRPAAGDASEAERTRADGRGSGETPRAVGAAGQDPTPG